HRGQGIGEMLVRQAVRLFAERRVTLADVWTREDNEAAVRLYRSAGFEPHRQLVMTWYPLDPHSTSGYAPTYYQLMRPFLAITAGLLVTAIVAAGVTLAILRIESRT